MTYNSDKLLLAVDLAGTFVFAVEGATAAIEGKLDFSALWCCRLLPRQPVGLFAIC
jgi:hypothetical protein